MTRRTPRRDESGAGAVLGLAMTGVLVSVTVAVGCGVSVVAAHRAAQAAADLAALAAAGSLQQGGDPCDRAAAIAEDNHGVLRGCRVEGWNVLVVVASVARLPVGEVQLPARARAGPVTPSSSPREPSGGGGQRF